MSTPWVEFRNVHFSYKKQNILEDFDFAMDQPQWVGVIGVNGSGKSTLLKLLLGLLKPQQGSVKIQGYVAGSKATRSFVGSALQDVDFPPSEKVEEVVQFVCDQFEDPLDKEELIQSFQLQDFRKKHCGQLSGGMKRRLALACAFAGQPKLVFLDEPTTGLDLESRLHLMGVLQKYQERQQALVFMISHHPEEIIGHVHSFLHVKNKSITPLSTEQMKKTTHLRKIQFLVAESYKLPQALRTRRQDGIVEVVTADSDDYLQKLVDHKVDFKDLLVSKLSVDELLGEFL